MCEFTVHYDVCTTILVDVYACIYEVQCAILLWLRSLVQAVEVGSELIDVVFVDHGKCIFHVPEPH